jgi:hypothetical protein
MQNATEPLSNAQHNKSETQQNNIHSQVTNSMEQSRSWEADSHSVDQYEGVSKSFLSESIMKYRLTFGITRSEATQRVMTAKLIRLTHKIAI